jgi:hypothetical protein
MGTRTGAALPRSVLKTLEMRALEPHLREGDYFPGVWPGGFWVLGAGGGLVLAGIGIDMPTRGIAPSMVAIPRVIGGAGTTFVPAACCRSADCWALAAAWCWQA